MVRSGGGGGVWQWVRLIDSFDSKYIFFSFWLFFFLFVGFSFYGEKEGEEGAKAL